MLRIAITLSLFTTGCVLTAAPPCSAEQPAPKAAAIEPAAQGKTKEAKGTLKGSLPQIGPTIDNPDGDGKVLPVTAQVELPAGKAVKFFSGAMKVRSLEDPKRVLWTGQVEFDPDEADTGRSSVFVNVPEDEANPSYVELKRSPVGFRVMQEKGILGPPVEIRLDRIEYSGGKTEKS